MMKKFNFLRGIARYSSKMTLASQPLVGRIPLSKVPSRGFAEGAAQEDTSVLKGHGKKDIHEIPAWQVEWVTGEILSCWSFEMLANVLEKYMVKEDAMTDQQLNLALDRMARFDMVPDDQFYDRILPIIKEVFALADRQRVSGFTESVNYLAALKVQDAELWDLIEKKLVDERLHRYLDVDQMIDNTIALYVAGRTESPFFEYAEKYMIKHRRWLKREKLSMVSDIYKEIGSGSDLFFQVLENPEKPLDVIDVQSSE